MSRRKKPDPDSSEFPFFPPGFLDKERVRKLLVQDVYRRRLREGPGALFDTKRHKARYDADIIIEVLSKIQRRLKKNGWVADFSGDELRILARHGHKKTDGK